MARKQAIGSNQYRQRAGSELATAVVDLMSQAGPSDRRRCGVIWGTDCRRWVRSPTWSHGDHGINGNRQTAANNPNCPPGALAQLASDGYWLVRWEVAGNPNTHQQWHWIGYPKTKPTPMCA